MTMQPHEWYGDPETTRSTTETLIRTMAIQVVATACYGHLMSLQNATGQPSITIFFYVFGSLLFPLLPLAQAMRNSVSTIHKAITQKSLRTARHLICGMLGIHIRNSRKESVPIVHYPHSHWKLVRQRYGILWIGRTIVLFALLVQFASTTILWVRRSLIYPGPYRLWATDSRDLQVVLGGIASVLTSISIHFLNSNAEEVERSGPEEIVDYEQQELAEPSHTQPDGVTTAPTQPNLAGLIIFVSDHKTKHFPNTSFLCTPTICKGISSWRMFCIFSSTSLLAWKVTQHLLMGLAGPRLCSFKISGRTPHGGQLVPSLAFGTVISGEDLGLTFPTFHFLFIASIVFYGWYQFFVLYALSQMFFVNSSSKQISGYALGAPYLHF